VTDREVKRSHVADSTARAITDDGAFRVIVARTTDTVRGITHAQEAVGRAAGVLGDLVTATVLFRETMAPNLRVQGILRDRGGLGSLVADSAPGGATRGLLQPAPKDQKKLSAAQADVLLQMMRTLPSGHINQGIIKMENSSEVTKGMMAYMKESEQVDTMLAVATVLDENGHVRAAGGYMVQLLPELGRAPLAIMAERLEEFRSIGHLLSDDFTPAWLRDELLYGMPFSALDESEVSFSCWCSEARLLGALATLDTAEIQSMIDDARPIEITCDYCRKDYAIPPARLRGLLKEN
jgi:molecular chaperone Hsp33